MKRGELWWYESPDREGRPVCVLTRPEAIEVLTSMTVVTATRTDRGLATEVALTRDDGVNEDWVLSLDNIRSVRKAYLTRYIATLDGLKMREVCRALAVATGC